MAFTVLQEFTGRGMDAGGTFKTSEGVTVGASGGRGCGEVVGSRGQDGSQGSPEPGDLSLCGRGQGGERAREEGHCRQARGALMEQGEAALQMTGRSRELGLRDAALASVRRHLPRPRGTHW